MHSAFCTSPTLAQSVPDEFRVKRQEVFEFSEKPTVARDGDSVTVRFAAKGFCDATVAIEDASGRIVRHLASGVLGPNAPAPFAKGSLRQTLVWDGKDDAGAYVDAEGGVHVRVSLGLKPRFERTLLWSPARRIGRHAPLFAAAEEGVYVYDGRGVDHLRLFDREGNYVRTIYPFPAGRIEAVDSLDLVAAPQLEERIPLKRNAYKNTLLTCGDNGRPCADDQSKDGLTLNAASAIAVGADRIAVVKYLLNRIAVDGSTGGLPLTGPKVSFEVPGRRQPHLRNARFDERRQVYEVAPRSAALSPDGKWLYLTAYQWVATNAVYQCDLQQALHGVMRLAYEGQSPAEPFVGTMAESGSDNAHFNIPSSVDCDAQGRVYVCDYANDRVQVFSEQGEHLKTIPARRPAKVRVNRKTGEIWVFSWVLLTRSLIEKTVPPTLTRFSAFPEASRQQTFDIVSMRAHRPNTGDYSGSGSIYDAEIDFRAEPARVWTAYELAVWPVYENIANDELGARRRPWERAGPTILQIDGDKLKPVMDFPESVRERFTRIEPPAALSQYLIVNTQTGTLWVAEAIGRRSGSDRINEIVDVDSGTGRARPIQPPFRPADVAFDAQGLAYLRGDDLIVRFDPLTWREVPWDYGEEGKVDGYTVISGLRCPEIPQWIWQGGMALSPSGAIAVAWPAPVSVPGPTGGRAVFRGGAWTPQVYPGRPTAGMVSIWDRHGKLIHRDAVPGIATVSGIGLDRDLDVTTQLNLARVLDGRPFPIPGTGTLAKLRPGWSRFLTNSDKIPIPLAREQYPERSLELHRHWVDDAQWLYGGVGYALRGVVHCFCWHSRFAMDYFGRSFAPEPDIFRVAVLDGNGNLVLRIGRYGNVDDGSPLVADGGPARTNALGGDEVGLFQPNYLGVHTDRRLFIADAGNGRILSVKLDYHATETVSLK